MATPSVCTSLTWDVVLRIEVRIEVTIEPRTRTAVSPLGRCRLPLVEFFGEDPTATGSRGEN
jgi:hypothetical protein